MTAIEKMLAVTSAYFGLFRGGENGGTILDYSKALA